MPINDLTETDPIVDPETGRPTPYFMRMIMDRGTSQLTLEQQVALLNALEIIAGAGLDGGGILGDGVNITLDANASDILDLITTTHGSILYRDSAAWAALGPGTSGDVLTTNGAAADPTWETPSGGGGSGIFAGMMGVGPSVTTSAFATKGTVFRPDIDLTVTHINGWVDAAATTDTYRVSIASLSSITLSSSGEVTALTIGTVLETSTAAAVNSTAPRVLRHELPNPVALTAGTDYIVVVSNTTGTGTTANRLYFSDVGSFNLPGVTHIGTAQFNTTGLSAGQTASGFGTIGVYNVWPEGTS